MSVTTKSAAYRAGYNAAMKDVEIETSRLAAALFIVQKFAGGDEVKCRAVHDVLNRVRYDVIPIARKSRGIKTP